MRESYKVVDYDNTGYFHECLDVGTGKRVRLDILVSGLGESISDPRELVGKIISCRYTHPYISIAEDVKIEEE